MTTAPAEWPGGRAPDTSGLRAALESTQSQPEQRRAIWAALESARPRAAAALAMRDDWSATPRPELNRHQCQELADARRELCRQVLCDMQRALASNTAALQALSLGVPSDLTAHQRAPLTAAVARRLTVVGATADELSVRRLTSAALTCWATALA